ncbi:MAG: YitT family protein [Alphaproteobacteria bacterium]
MVKTIVKSGHSIFEDCFSILLAVVMFSVGIVFFKESGLVAGGTSGLALILAYITDLSFGAWFIITNAPFFILSFVRMGLRFTMFTLLSVLLVSYFVDHYDLVLSLTINNKLFASLISGTFIGVSLIILFRHRSSMGGLGVLALFLQDNFNISAGKVSLSVDVVLMTTAFFLFDIETVIYSAISLFIVSFILMINHKEGRYTPNTRKK